jgi:hypothetical protein
MLVETLSLNGALPAFHRSETRLLLTINAGKPLGGGGIEVLRHFLRSGAQKSRPADAFFVDELPVRAMSSS